MIQGGRLIDFSVHLDLEMSGIINQAMNYMSTKVGEPPYIAPIPTVNTVYKASTESLPFPAVTSQRFRLPLEDIVQSELRRFSSSNVLLILLLDPKYGVLT